MELINFGKMKKIFAFLSAAVLLSACHNKPFDYEDFDYPTVCLPFQYPVRTLSLGNDVLDNSLDRAHKFNIGVVLGGVYIHNDISRRVYYEVDESLVSDNLYNQNDERIRVLPSRYYKFSTDGSVEIPQGKLNGLITVQLADEFFDDPDAHKGVYVIPMRITEADRIDSVLSGRAAVANPNLHEAAHWEITPKNYTLFGVKYVNPYHGKWLRRGALVVKNPAGEEIDRIVYRTADLELNETVSLTTVSMSDVVGGWQIKGEKFALRLSVTDGEITVSSQENAAIDVAGTGRYAENDAEWGGTVEKPRKRDVLYLKYAYDRADGNKCEVCDTLVFRDRAIVFEDNRPKIK